MRVARRSARDSRAPAADAAREIGDVLGRLVTRSGTIPPQEVPALVARELEGVGCADVEVRMRTLDQRDLVLLGGRVDEHPAETVPVDGSLVGRAYSTSRSVDQLLDDARVRVHQPALDGSERVGVLSTTVDADVLDADVRDALAQVAALVATLVVTKSAYTDAYLTTRRTRPMTLPAQLQWQLLPPLTLRTELVEIAGALEPAHDIAGDSFDYALNDGVLHLCVLDAMGHGLDAATMATLVVAAYRHERQRDADLPALYASADRTLEEQFGPETFATAQMARLDVRSGLLRWVNAGHPPPLLLRDRTVVRALERPTTLPVGLGGDTPEVHAEQLEPGDAVLFHTDGVTDERMPDGTFFGESRLYDLLEQVSASEQRVEEMVRRLSLRLLDARGGVTTDDVTLLLVRWSGRAVGTTTSTTGSGGAGAR